MYRKSVALDVSSVPQDRFRLFRPKYDVFNGFTLIELLVVIAVIAIIAAILFPVFAKAREKARQVACLSNMRQVTLALLQYAADSDDRCPPYTDGLNNFWPQFVSSYVQHQVTPDFNGASKVFICPSASYDAAKIKAFNNSSISSYGLSDNWMNFICPDDCEEANGVPHAFGEAVAPAQTVLLAETMYSTEAGLPGYALATSPIDGGDRGFIYASCDNAGRAPFSPARMLADLSWRHVTPKAAWCADPPAEARINVSYADGHVKSGTATQLSRFSQWSLSQGAGTSGHYRDSDGQMGYWYP